MANRKLKTRMLRLTEPQDTRLQAEAAQLGMGVSELVRRAIDAYSYTKGTMPMIGTAKSFGEVFPDVAEKIAEAAEAIEQHGGERTVYRFVQKDSNLVSQELHICKNVFTEPWQAGTALFNLTVR